MDIQAFLARHQLPADYETTAQKWFIPVADTVLAHRDGAKRPFVVGINGCQGSGKSTLAAFLESYLHSHCDLSVVTLSIDDFYLSQSQRHALAIKVHPLLATRGVPGTHDIGLAQTTLQQLAQYGTASLPRFDKATDNPRSVTEWPVVNTPVDIVLLEGWCVGARAQPDSAMAEPVNALEREQDPLGIWRKFVNAQLGGLYHDLFEHIDHLIMLRAPSFDQVYTWRCEQEHKLISSLSSAGKSKAATMSDEQIAEFIQLYQRITEHCLEHLPTYCQQVLQLDRDRSIIRWNKE